MSATAAYRPLATMLLVTMPPVVMPLVAMPLGPVRRLVLHPMVGSYCHFHFPHRATQHLYRHHPAYQLPHTLCTPGGLILRKLFDGNSDLK